MKKNLLVIIILTIAIVAGIYNLHEVKDETIQMQSTLQQSAKEVKPTKVVTVKEDPVRGKLIVPEAELKEPYYWDQFRITGPNGNGYLGYTLGSDITVNEKTLYYEPKSLGAKNNLAVYEGQLWMYKEFVIDLLKLRDEGKLTDPTYNKGFYTTKNLNIISEVKPLLVDQPFYWKGKLLSNKTVYACGWEYWPVSQIMREEGFTEYDTTEDYCGHRFNTPEFDKKEREWLYETGINHMLLIHEDNEYYPFDKTEINKKAGAKQDFRKVFNCAETSLNHAQYSNSRLTTTTTASRIEAPNMNPWDIITLVNPDEMEYGKPIVATVQYDAIPREGKWFVEVIPGQYFYYLGTESREVRSGKYRGWYWVDGTNVLYREYEETNEPRFPHTEIVAVPVGTKLTVENTYVGSADVQVAVTNKVF